jgi:hypothetical protein
VYGHKRRPAIFHKGEREPVSQLGALGRGQLERLERAWLGRPLLARHELNQERRP